MASQVLARKWRPHNFESVVGQEPVVQALTHALRENRLHHAYLFTGTRGVGKTTLSRILAKSLNCVGPDGKGGVTDHPCGVCEACRAIDEGRFVDYIEMDAASNRSVEEMTALLEQAMYAPTNARYKVYMIDEVHQLTTHAFNAMLKTLEEPPEYVKFILATTDPQKVPVTVLSRCIQFNLRNVTPQIVAEHMKHILTEEKIEAEPAALKLLGIGARGSMRDGLSLLDQAIAFAGDKPVTLDSVREMLGMMDSDVLVKLLQALAQGDAHQMLEIANTMSMRSLSFSQAIRDLAAILHRIALAQFDPASVASDDLDRDAIFELAQTFSPQEVQLYYQITLNARGDMNLAPDEYAGFTMALMRMLAFKPAGVVKTTLPKRFSFDDVKSTSTTNQNSIAPKVESKVLATSVATSEVANVRQELPATPSLDNDPAPWEDLPVSSQVTSDKVASLEPKKLSTEEAVVESKPVTKPSSTVIDDDDDDVPYSPDGAYDEAAYQESLDPFDDYGMESAPTMDSMPGYDMPEAEPVEEEPSTDMGSGYSDYYEFAQEEEIPEFSEVGKLWYEKMRYTYPSTYARDILFRSECVAIEGNVIRLRLDPFYAGRLRNEQAMRLVQRIVDPVFGHRMKIEIELESPRSRTIHQQKVWEKRQEKKAEEAKWLKSHYVAIDDPEEKKAAIEALKNTPQAKIIARRFNARIDQSSIKKLVSRQS